MNLAQISSSVILIIAITLVSGEKLNNFSIPNDIRLPNYVIPLHYSIKLISFVNNNDFYMVNLRNTERGNFVFYGESNTTINILRSTRNISLHTLNLNVNELVIKMIKSDSMIYELKEFSHDFTTHLSILRFIDVLSPGLYTLKMEFVGRITDENVENFTRTSYTNKENMKLLIGPHVQEIGARRLFPCWDEPNLKTTFTISIKYHRNFTVLSNMPVLTYNMDNDDLMWTHFHTIPPMSTDQVSIVITNFHRIHIIGNTSLWCEKCSNQHYVKFAQQVIKNITLHLESEFKEVKIPKIDHVTSNFSYVGTSKWGLVFHREADLIYDEKLDPVIRKMEIVHLITLKIAYQWLGNAVGPSWWSNLWLYGGLATLYGEEAIAKTFNKSWKDLFIVQNQYECLHLDSHFDMIPSQINSLSEIDSILSFSPYMKAPIVLRMLQSIITDEVFRKGVHAYLHTYMFRSVTPYYFWATMQEELNKITSESMEDITGSFTTWMTYMNYPVVNIKRDHNGNILITQKDFNILDNKKWWIPMNYFMQKSLPKSTKIWLIPQENDFRILSPDKDSWILINFEQTGYYRVNYESENWRKIISFLNSEEYKNINVISRAKIIDDAFHLMMASQLNISIFWELTKYLSQETDYVAWYPMIKIMEYMSSSLPFSRYDIRLVDDIKYTLKELLEKSLKTLGFEKRPMENNLTQSLRQEIAKWACRLAVSECMEAASRKLKQHLGNPEKYKLLPEWKEWTYCNGLKIADYSMWYNVTNIWLKKPDHQLLPFLPCCRYRFVTSHYLPFLISQRFTQYEIHHTVIIRSYVNTFHSIIAKHANNFNMLRNMLLNWEKIKPEFYKGIATTTFLTTMINHVYSENLLNKILDLLKNVQYINSEEMLKIQHKIKTRSTEIKNQISYFQVMKEGN